jgi:hypothetical protein
MTSQRSRFLASLGERLQSDLAATEQNREELTPAPWPERTGQPSGDEPAPEEIAGDRIGRAPARRAAQVESERGRGHEAGAPADATAPIGALVSSDGERTLRPSVPWSETGLPLRLREAIASVRRVSHEMHEPAGDDYAMYGRMPFADHPAYHDHSSDDAAAYRESPPDDPLAGDAVPEDARIRFGVHPPYEEPPADELVPLEDDAALQHAQMRLDHDAAYQEPTANDELILLDDDVADGDGQTRYGHHAAYEEPPPDDELRPHDEDGAYPHGRIPLARDAAYQEPGDQAARAHRWLDDDGDGQESPPGYWEDPRDRQPLWRGATRRYGLHAAAFAVAIAFVALAGFGLGILSGAGDVAGPLARDTLRALTEPAPRSSAQDAPLAEPERPAAPGELVTVRVAPAPVAAVPGPAPAAPASSSALPLPPPPKPVLRQSAPAKATPIDRQLEVAGTSSAPAEAASADRQLAAAGEDAAAAPLEATGTGGPFQPLFAKLPASRSAQTRVFVHYSAGVVGAPATAMHLVRHLKAAGFAVEVRAIEFPIPTNSIRYFFDNDRAQAEALRARLEGQLPGDAALELMDFTSYQPRPRPGLIEIWLRA